MNDDDDIMDVGKAMIWLICGLVIFLSAVAIWGALLS